MLLASFRLLLSGAIAFFFYAAWAYYANSLVTDDEQVLYKAALVQGSYSGGITLVFTFVLELFYKIFRNKSYCLPFVIPVVTFPSFTRSSVKPSSFGEHESVTKKAFESSLQASEKSFNGVCVPGILLTPLPAIILQSIFVIGVNIAFKTPNLWLTVAPSIFFSAIYGYIYTISLSRKLKRVQV